VLRDIPVTVAMASRVIATHPDELVETAELLMHDNQIRRVPVIDDAGRPVGMVSLNDLARLAARSNRSGVNRELVRTMAAICQPRQHPRPDGEVRAAPTTALVL
jgi:CBS domain-containing protein